MIRKGGFRGQKLYEARFRKGYTQLKLAQLMDLSSSIISHYEHNEKDPKPNMIKKLCELLDVEIDFFYTK